MVEVPTPPGSPLGALGSPRPLRMPAPEGIASKCCTYVIDGVSMLRTCSHLLHPAPQRSAAPPATPTAVPGTSSSSTHSLFRLVLSLSLAHPRVPRHRPIARAHEHVPLTPSCPPSAASLTHLRAILSTQMLSSCHHGLAHLRAPCHAPCFARPSLSPTLVLSRAPLRTLQASVPLAELRRLAHQAPPSCHLAHAPVVKMLKWLGGLRV